MRSQLIENQNLRWIERYDKRILQMAVKVTDYIDGKIVGGGMRWIDVPFEEGHFPESDHKLEQA